MIFVFLYQIALLSILTGLMAYTLLRGNGHLPAAERAFLGALMMDFIAQAIQAASRLFTTLQMDFGGVYWSGVVRLLSISLLTFVIVLRTRQWVRMRNGE